eukprot:CAMPEP_0119480898 /NCGR_PEP_ID=MMETSP1344-20130328/9498_1 /TAXON_ID=236787 /ORGANISM="Florenciella parvula, Strain CCMP2471" /LENGTH=117 /DNA_ID=CAMNT_0007515251 /DNA_START=463 /DNA_END=816 /DNA_ORIENTATION=+
MNIARIKRGPMLGSSPATMPAPAVAMVYMSTQMSHAKPHIRIVTALLEALLMRIKTALKTCRFRCAIAQSVLVVSGAYNLVARLSVEMIMKVGATQITSHTVATNTLNCPNCATASM